MSFSAFFLPTTKAKPLPLEVPVEGFMSTMTSCPQCTIKSCIKTFFPSQVPGSGAYFAGNEFAKRMMIPAGGSVADLGPGQLLLAGGTAGCLMHESCTRFWFVIVNTFLVVIVNARALSVVTDRVSRCVHAIELGQLNCPLDAPWLPNCLK